MQFYESAQDMADFAAISKTTLFEDLYTHTRRRASGRLDQVLYETFQELDAAPRRGARCAPRDVATTPPFELCRLKVLISFPTHHSRTLSLNQTTNLLSNKVVGRKDPRLSLIIEWEI